MKQSNLKTPAFSRIVLILFVLIPLINIVIMFFMQFIKQKKKIKNSRETRILSLNKVTSQITAEELYNIDRPKCFFYNYYEETGRSSVKFIIQHFSISNVIKNTSLMVTNWIPAFFI